MYIHYVGKLYIQTGKAIDDLGGLTVILKYTELVTHGFLRWDAFWTLLQVIQDVCLAIYDKRRTCIILKFGKRH